MTPQPTALFLINPRSGTRIGKQAPALQRQIADVAKQHGWQAEPVITEYKGHSIELTRQAVREGVARVVAVGGDGTINEIAQELRHTNTALGILPFGSGNGLARHFSISLKPEVALDQFFTREARPIDYGLANDIPFFCTSGVGFDAYVGDLFDKATRRGFSSYISITFKAYWQYKPVNYRINGEPKTLYTATFANASQYGNNAWIAPQANVADGQLDVNLTRPFPLTAAPRIFSQLFTKNLSKSPFVALFRTQQITLEADEPLLIHYDGEPRQLNTNRLTVMVVPGGIQVVY